MRGVIVVDEMSVTIIDLFYSFSYSGQFYNSKKMLIYTGY